MDYNDGRALVITKAGTMVIKRSDNSAFSFERDKETREVTQMPLHSFENSFSKSTKISALESENVYIKGAGIKFVENDIPFLIENAEKASSVNVSDRHSNLEAVMAAKKTRFVKSDIVSSDNMLKYLSPRRIGDMMGIANVYHTINSIKIKRGFAVSSSKTKRDYYPAGKKAKTFVYEDSERVFLKPLELYVVENFVSSNQYMGASNLEPITATVEDYKPPSWGDTGSGSGLKSLRWVVQKMAFAEITLQFTDARPTDVLGLPRGMGFYPPVIKGSPLLSGNYPISIKMDNGNTLEGLMVVPQVPREL